jgi:hypothetical protein
VSVKVVFRSISDMDEGHAGFCAFFKISAISGDIRTSPLKKSLSSTCSANNSPILAPR